MTRRQCARFLAAAGVSRVGARQAPARPRRPNDGIGPQWGGVEFTALKKNAPNTWAGPAHYAAVDTEAVEVHVEPAGNFGPAGLTITAKFQCGWYQ